jgi:arylsulfatase A-like enzyme
MSTFWAVSGPGIRQNHTIRQPVANYDMVPTLLRALQQQAPWNWRGRAVSEAFTDVPLPGNSTEVNDVQNSEDHAIFSFKTNSTDRGGWLYVEQNDKERTERCLSKTKQANFLEKCKYIAYHLHSYYDIHIHIHIMDIHMMDIRMTDL